MSIYRTNNPLEYDDVDQIVIDDRAPSPSIVGVGTGTVVLVGQMQRGPSEITPVPSTQDLQRIYGVDKAAAFKGTIALLNKKFSRLSIVQVKAADAVKGTLTLLETATPILRIDAKFKGAYGNLIKVLVEAGTTVGNKYTFSDDNPDSVIEDEVFDNVEVLNIDGTTFALSELVDVVVLATSAEPDALVVTPLAAGAEGTIVDTDYETALIQAEGEDSGNIIFLDDYNEVRNVYIKTHVGLTNDKMGIMSHGENDAVATVIAAVPTLRDTAGRLIYAYNWVKTTVAGIPTFTSPASWYASILSQTGPQLDPAFAENTQFLFGVTGLKKNLSRPNFVALMAAGVSAFEFDADIGFKVKSGIVTQIANSSKVTVLRRRMTDFLTVSIAKFYKNYQNGPNRRIDRVAMQAATINFIEDDLEKNGITPKDAEVQGGNAKIVDIDSLNTDASLATGKNIIKYKQRIFSSMRFIVLISEIGESVVVTEGE